MQKSAKNTTKTQKNKLLIGLGIMFAISIGAIAFVKCKKTSKMSETKEVTQQANDLLDTIKDKIKFNPLVEHIDFKEAKTLEEARIYTKEVLKIEHIDDAFSLDALNWVNRGLTDVSNAMQGKLKMPNSLIFQKLEKGTEAGIDGNVFSDTFGRMCINPEVFNPKRFESELKNIMYHGSDRTFKDGNFYLYQVLKLKPTGKLQTLIDKYYNNSLTALEKNVLYQYMSILPNKARYYLKTNPMETLKILSKKYPKLSINIEELSKLNTAEQSSILQKHLSRLAKEGNSLSIEVNGEISPFRTIYHEMGHLQDTVINPICDFRMNRSALERMIAEGKIKDFPSEYKNFYNEETQRIAEEVSNYSKSNISEFIAEVFAENISGNKLSSKVENLYLGYNAPIIPNRNLRNSMVSLV